MTAVPDADLAPLWVPSVAHELTAEGWLALFWQLVEEGDLAAAYWLACSLPLQPEPTFTPLSDRQIAALQASWWLPSGRGALAQDLTEIVYTNNVDDSAVAQIAGVAAAIVPTLTHPATSISGWLKPLEGMPNPLNDIIAAIETFASHGQPLDEADVAAVRGADQRAQELAQLIIQAQLWLQQGPHRRTSFKRASDVWRVGQAQVAGCTRWWKSLPTTAGTKQNSSGSGSPTGAAPQSLNASMKPICKSWVRCPIVSHASLTVFHVRGYHPSRRSCRRG